MQRERDIRTALIAARIRARRRGEMVETGRDLLVAKVALPHGGFMVWVEAECGISMATADRAMRAARVALRRRTGRRPIDETHARPW